MPNSRGIEDADLPQTAALFGLRRRKRATPAIQGAAIRGLQYEMPGFHISDPSSLDAAGGHMGTGALSAALRVERSAVAFLAIAISEI
jgi:hypothetical protein